MRKSRVVWPAAPQTGFEVEATSPVFINKCTPFALCAKGSKGAEVPSNWRSGLGKDLVICSQ